MKNLFEEVKKSVQWVLDNRTSYEVAKALNVNARTINRYQNGTSEIGKMSFETAEKIYSYYLKEMEKLEMNKLIEKWENELQHEMTNDEIVDYWTYEISAQYSQNRWYGLNYIWIFEYTLENGDIYYVVSEESASELVKQNEERWTIENTLLNPTHEIGDHVIVGIFTDKDEALNFAKEGYPKIDVEKELDEMFLEDEED